MRYLILSDIHGNLDALEAVLAYAEGQRVEGTLILGDLVGYGASPRQVIERIRDLRPAPLLVRGNHDKVVAGLERSFRFHAEAREAVLWTATQLDQEQRDWLAALPAGPVPGPEGSVLCHGSPLDEDDYLLSVFDAFGAFDRHPGRLVFFGHSHVACAFVLADEEVEGWLVEGESHAMDLVPGCRYLVNPGSVGQPRDRDPRACCLIWDSFDRRIEWRRVDYDVASARARILDAGLPAFFADRLERGV